MAYPKLFEEKKEAPKDGVSFRLYIKGKSSMKPKIPKSKKGKAIYRGFFKRSSKPFTFIYDIESTIYICALHDQIDVDKWLDKNYDKIQGKLNEYTTPR